MGYQGAADSKRKVGSRAEELACEYLERLGFRILDRNFTIRGGEIDIIARDGDELVFVEVKARYNHKYGLPQESITYYKLKALQKTALFYVQKIKWGNGPYRIDLLAMDFAFDPTRPEIELVKNISF